MQAKSTSTGSAELSVLRMLGLFDRPADEKALGALRKPPAIHGLTESLTNLSPTEWRTILARLKRARLLACEDLHNPGCLDTHPLVRQYFGEQLRSQQMDAWKECNRRLFHHYRTLAPQLPNSLDQMEPLFLAASRGCNTGLFHEVLHEVYIPRIQRGKSCFAANILGAKAALLSVLVNFFEDKRWGSPMETGMEGQSLTAEDQLFILMQAALYLTSMRGFASMEAKTCYERAESLCHALNRPLLLYSTLLFQWSYSFVTEKLTATLQIAKRIYSLTQSQDDPAVIVGGYSVLAATHCYLGDDFEIARQYAVRGLQIWRRGVVRSLVGEMLAPSIVCLCYQALSEWHFGEITCCQATIVEAISLSKELNDPHGLALALYFSAYIAHYSRNPSEVERFALDLIELSTHKDFAFWLPGATVLRGWARSASGFETEGILWIERGVGNYRASGATLCMPYYLALKAEALHLADRAPEALEAIEQAEGFAERIEERWWRAELYRLRGVFLTAIGAEESKIEASFGEAIRIAREQKSVSLEKRAEGTYAEYRRQKASGSGGRGFRLPL